MAIVNYTGCRTITLDNNEIQISDPSGHLKSLPCVTRRNNGPDGTIQIIRVVLNRSTAIELNGRNAQENIPADISQGSSRLTQNPNVSLDFKKKNNIKNNINKKKKKKKNHDG
jgi:hypothetical protein